MRDVLLVTIDSLRADHVHCMGYDRETTPEIDALATDGHLFEETYAHACSTRPSFPSILSSSHALNHGGFERMTEGRTMLAEVFDDAGYDTAGFHSNLYLSADFGYDRGFNTFYDSKADPSLMAKARQYTKENINKDSIIYRILEKLYNSTEMHAGINVGAAYDTATEITDRAIEWAKGADENSPRFLWVHYMDVHHPYVPPDSYQLEFREEPLTEAESIKLRRKMLQNPTGISDEELQNIVDLYDAEIRYTDAQIGRLIQELSDIWGQKPILGITSDHGEEFLDHGKFSHHATFYDEVTHVPLIIGGVGSSGNYEGIVGLQDVPATLVDYANLGIPDDFDGHSLRQLIENGSFQREYVIGDWGNRSGKRRFAYRDNEWKLIQRNAGEELYKLTEDPKEQRNVVDEFPNIATELGNILEEHKQKVRANSESMVEADMDEDVKERLRNLGYAE